VHQPPFTPRKIPGTHFCHRLSRPQDHCAAGRMRSITKSNDLIRIQTSDLPACITVPQPCYCMSHTYINEGVLKIMGTGFQTPCIYLLVTNITTSQTLSTLHTNCIISTHWSFNHYGQWGRIFFLNPA
jgi:hypothetical protein